jgi:hypothetical protein
MIEQGLIGLVTKLFFFIMLLFFFLRKYAINKNLASFGLGVTIFFLLFSIGTGPLGAWPLTMILLGIVIKTILIIEREHATRLSL